MNIKNIFSKVLFAGVSLFLAPSVSLALSGNVISKIGQPLSASFIMNKQGDISNASLEIYQVFGISMSSCLQGSTISGSGNNFLVSGVKKCKDKSISLIVSVGRDGSKTFEEVSFIQRAPSPVKKVHKQTLADKKTELERSKLTWMGQRKDGYYYFKTGDTLMKAAYIIRSKTYLEKGPTAISKCLFDGSKKSFIKENPNKVRSGSTVKIVDAVNCEVTYEDAYAFFNSFKRMDSAKKQVAKLNVKSRGAIFSKTSTKTVVATKERYSKHIGLGGASIPSEKMSKKVRMSPKRKSNRYFSDATEVSDESPINPNVLLDKAFSDHVIAGVLPLKMNTTQPSLVSRNANGEVRKILEKQIGEKESRIVVLSGEIKQIRKVTTAKMNILTETIGKLTKENYMLYAAILSILVSIISFLVAWFMHKKNSKMPNQFLKYPAKKEND